MKKSQKLLFCVILVAVCLPVFFYLFGGVGENLEIYDKTLRLHIPANSNSEEDQALKLKVRDAVISLLEKPLSSCENKAEAVAVVEEMKSDIEKIADKVIASEGREYKAKVTVTQENYPRREYEGISLPAGEYTSVKIELGEADGKNWWCVLFPQVCTSSACPEQVLAEVGFTASQIKLLTEDEETEYVVKFKVLEFVENLFK